MHRPDPDPPPRAQDLCPHQLYGNKRNQAETIGPWNPVNQFVIVDLGEQKHRHHSTHNPINLLRVESNVLRVKRCGINLEDRNGAQQRDKAE